MDKERRKMNRRMKKMIKASPPDCSKVNFNLSQSTLYETPPQCKKQVRQRTFECMKTMPRKNKEVRCAVAHRIVKKLIKSPSTSTTMQRILDLHSSYSKKASKVIELRKTKYPLPKLEARFLQRMILKIKKLKATKQTDKYQRSVNDVKKKYSIRAMSKHFDMHYSQMHRLLSWKYTHGRSLPETCKNHALKFFMKNSISQQIPYKRYARYYYLRTPLAVAYELYAQKQRMLGFRVLSRSSVYRCLKGKIRVRQKIPFKDCQCDICLNVSLLIDALVAFKVMGISRRITQNVLKSLCNLKSTVGSIRRKLELGEDKEVVLTDHDRDCIFRKCNCCGGVKLQEEIIKQNPNVDWSRIVTWHQWEYVRQSDEGSKNIGSSTGEKEKNAKRYFDKVRYHGTLSQLLSLFNKAILQLSIHLFHFRWQAFQFDECKQQLQNGDVLMVMDFAQNYTHHRQDEVHGAFWTRRQSTLHPIIIYYVCPENCGHLVRNEVMMVSSDLKHDGFAVNAFVDKAMEHLKQNNVHVRRIVMFSDNCGAQYKCCKVFDSISKVTIPLLRGYFCARHGKAEADGAIGRLSMHLDAVVRSGSREFSNSTAIADYCRKNLTVPKSPGDIQEGQCQHFRKHYYEVNDIVRDDSSDAKTVQGTMTFHCVRNTGHDGIIEVRESACFCDTCFLNVEGECKNKRLVEPFAWASLKKRKDDAKKIPVKLNNTVWGSFSCPYRPTRKRIKLVQSQASRKRNSSSEKVSTKKCKSLQKPNISDSDETDYEDNIPLSELAAALDLSTKDTPVGFRTRQRLYKKEWVRCDTERQQYSLDDLEMTRNYTKVKHKKQKGQANKGQTSTSPVKTPDVSLSGIAHLSSNLISSASKLLNSRQMITSTPRNKTYTSNVELVSVPCSPITCIPEHIVHAKITADCKFSWSQFHRKLMDCDSFKSLVKLSHESEMPPLPERLFGDTPASQDEPDQLAKTYVPHDIPSMLMLHNPIQVLPDGNCFFRCLSRLAYGSEDNHLEMRCRIVMDSVCNYKRYTDHEYLMRGGFHVHSKCFHIGGYYCTYSGVNAVGNRDRSVDGIKSVFREDILRIRKVSEWADIWQMHSAANILTSKIFVVFPSKNVRLSSRVDFNRVFLPQNCDSPNLKQFGLMWSNLTASSSNYNHLVPFIQRYSTCDFN